MRGSRPFTRGWNSMCTWKLTAIDCIYFLQSVLATSVARRALRWENESTTCLWPCPGISTGQTPTVVGLPRDPLSWACWGCSWILSSQVLVVRTTGMGASLVTPSPLWHVPCLWLECSALHRRVYVQNRTGQQRTHRQACALTLKLPNLASFNLAC